MEFKFLKLIPILICIVFGIPSCINEHDEPPQLVQNNEYASSSNLARALQDAENLKKMLSIENNRQHETHKVIEPIVKTTTRGNCDTLYYIVNYGEGDGFAVLCTTPQLETVQAISETGSLHLSDTLRNNGLCDFFNMLELKIEMASIENSTRTTPPISSFDPQPDNDFIRNVSTSKHGPLLTSVVRMWDQDFPYNKYCPNVAKEPAFKPAKVGCMALSATQIMTYYEFPPKIDGIKIDWKSIKNHNSDTTFKILSYIGKLLNLEYGANITKGIESMIVPMFNSLGYSLSKTSKQFNQSVALSDLSQYGPLLVYSNFNSTGTGHAWVIDGWYSTLYEEKVIGDDSLPTWKKRTSTLFHCVWGEISGANGYYRWSDVSSSIGSTSPELSEEDDKKGKTGYVMTNVHYYTNFK